MSQECDMALKKSNTILSSIHLSIIPKSWKVIIPMYSFLASLNLDTVSSSGHQPYIKKDSEKLEQV